MEKLKLLILVGTDGTGKSTLKKTIEVKSNWKYIVVDRLTDSIIYDQIYGRGNRSKLFYKFEEDLSKIADVFLIYLHCGFQKQLERLKDKKEDEETVANILKAKMLFEDNYLNKTKLKVKLVDTTTDSVEESADKVIKFVEEQK